MNNKTKKSIVLFALFIVPLLFYLFISSGTNNFAKLPVMTPKVTDIATTNVVKPVSFQNRISIVCFLGHDAQSVKGSFFNLNQKIYKPFYGFKDFQIVAIYPKEKKEVVEKLKTELSAFTDMVKWKFVGLSEEEIKKVFGSFKTNIQLDTDLYTPKAFILDKEMNLRGRSFDEDRSGGKLFGYNMESVAELNNKMKGDVKIILAEYRLALKKNNADREI